MPPGAVRRTAVGPFSLPSADAAGPRWLIPRSVSERRSAIGVGLCHLRAGGPCWSPIENSASATGESERDRSRARRLCRADQSRSRHPHATWADCHHERQLIAWCEDHPPVPLAYGAGVQALCVERDCHGHTRPPRQQRHGLRACCDVDHGRRFHDPGLTSWHGRQDDQRGTCRVTMRENCRAYAGHIFEQL